MAGRRIRKAVIPVAGLGTRFLPATKALPKEMLPLIDTPAIQFVVEEAVSCGLEDILLITGRHKRAIEDHFDRSRELEAELSQRGRPDLLKIVEHASHLADLHYIRQKAPRGLGDAVRHAGQHVGNEPFALLLADDIVPPSEPLLADMLTAFERVGHSIVCVEEVPPDEVGRYGVVAPVEPTAEVCFPCRDIVEKPPAGEAPSNLAVIGRYILTPEVFTRLRRARPGVGGEVQLTDALAVMARAGRLWAYRHDGHRLDTGEPLAYVRSTVLVALDRPDLRAPMLDFLREVVASEDGVPGSGTPRPVPARRRPAQPLRATPLGPRPPRDAPARDS